MIPQTIYRRVSDLMANTQWSITYHCTREVKARTNVPHSNVGEQVGHACPNEEHAHCETELFPGEVEVCFDIH